MHTLKDMKKIADLFTPLMGLNLSAPTLSLTELCFGDVNYFILVHDHGNNDVGGLKTWRPGIYKTLILRTAYRNK